MFLTGLAVVQFGLRTTAAFTLKNDSSKRFGFCMSKTDYNIHTHAHTHKGTLFWLINIHYLLPFSYNAPKLPNQCFPKLCKLTIILEIIMQYVCVEGSQLGFLTNQN